jgi:hypothetical protein
MDDVEFYRRRLEMFMSEGNRMMLKLPSDESRIFNDALHKLIDADALLSGITKGRREKVCGGGS